MTIKLLTPQQWIVRVLFWGLVLFPFLGWVTRETFWFYLFVLLIGLNIGYVLFFVRKIVFMTGREMALTAAILALLGVPALFATNYAAALDEWLHWVTYLLTFFVLRAHRRQTGEPFAETLKVVAIGGALSSLYALVRFSLDGVSNAWVIGQFGWHNVFAVVLGATVFLSAGCYLNAKVRREVLGWGFVTILQLVALVMTYSRATLAIFAGVGLVLLVRVLQTHERKALLLKLAVVLALAIFMVKMLNQSPLMRVFPATLHSRAEVGITQQSSSLQGRLDFWQGALGMFREYPLVGVGYGSFGDYFPRHQSDVRYYANDPHSLILKVLAEGGLVAFAGFALLTLVIFRLLAMEFIRLKRIRFELTSLTALLAFAALVLHAMVDIDAQVPALMVLGVILLVEIVATQRVSISREQSLYHRWHAIAVGAFTFVICFVGTGLMISDKLAASAADAYDLGEYQQAQTLLKQAINLNPVESVYRVNLALTEFALSRDEECLRQMEKALTLNSFDARAWALQGIFYSQMGRLTDAISAYERALELDPLNHPVYFVELAFLRTLASDQAGAITLLETMRSIYTPQVMQSDMPSRDLVRSDVVKGYEFLATLTGGEKARLIQAELATFSAGQAIR